MVHAKGTVFTCGNVKDAYELSCSLKRLHPWVSNQGVSIPPYLIQNIAWIQDQRSMPSCVGQAISACFNADEKRKSSSPRYVSATSIWKDARRRDGNIAKMMGTSLGVAVEESLLKRGLSPYVEGENEDWDNALRPDGLDAELDASDRILPAIKRYAIFGLSKVQEVVNALAQGKYVVFGATVNQGYMDHRADQAERALTIHEIGSQQSLGGHAQRVCGYRTRYGAYEFLVQNSWGPGWGGAKLENGLIANGCAWVEEDVIDSGYSWDFHVLDLS